MTQPYYQNENQKINKLTLQFTCFAFGRIPIVGMKTNSIKIERKLITNKIQLISGIHFIHYRVY